MKKLINDNKEISILLFIFLVIKLISILSLGIRYNINSDDMSYIKSGFLFLETGKITMHGVISAQIMPGMTFLIAIFAFILGKGLLFWIGLKLFWLLMSLISIYTIYKIVTIYTPKIYGILACIFFLVPDFIWMDNLILTETPFMLLFILLVYNCLMLEKTRQNKYYIYIVTFYLLALLIRPNIALVPIFLFIYLIANKYNFKLVIKQGLIALGIMLIFIIPWTIRNYALFNAFIPLTYGTGNPLLLGTYQGVGYPLDKNLDYKTNVDDKMKEIISKYKVNNQLKPYMKSYLSLESDKLKAEYRMREWWKSNPHSMIKTYFYYKPMAMVKNSFYWYEVFNIPFNIIMQVRNIQLLLFAMSLAIILISKKFLKETLFLLELYGYHIALYSYTFAYARYAQTLYFFQYIIIALGLYNLTQTLKRNK